jgi:hypothetical protein
MDLIEKQRKRRKRGVSAILVAMLLLMLAIRQASANQVRSVDFVLIYFSGIPLGAGLAMVVASYKITRELAGK